MLSNPMEAHARWSFATAARTVPPEGRWSRRLSSVGVGRLLQPLTNERICMHTRRRLLIRPLASFRRGGWRGVVRSLPPLLALARGGALEVSLLDAAVTSSLFVLLRAGWMLSARTAVTSILRSSATFAAMVPEHLIRSTVV